MSALQLMPLAQVRGLCLDLYAETLYPCFAYAALLFADYMSNEVIVLPWPLPGLLDAIQAALL